MIFELKFDISLYLRTKKEIHKKLIRVQMQRKPPPFVTLQCALEKDRNELQDIEQDIYLNSL